jgi:hypothetical protein
MLRIPVNPAGHSGFKAAGISVLIRRAIPILSGH